MFFFSHLTPGGLRTTLCSTDSAALFMLLSLLYVLLSVFVDVCQPLVSEAPPPSSSCLKSPLWLAETQTDRRNNIFNKGCEIMMRWDDTEVTWMWLILYNRGGTRQRPHNTILYESQFFTFLFNCSKWIYSLALFPMWIQNNVGGRQVFAGEFLQSLYMFLNSCVIPNSNLLFSAVELALTHIR